MTQEFYTAAVLICISAVLHKQGSYVMSIVTASMAIVLLWNVWRNL